MVDWEEKKVWLTLQYGTLWNAYRDKDARTDEEIKLLREHFRMTDEE